METRVCKCCGVEKPIEEFTMTRGNYNYVCKECSNKKKRETWDKKKVNRNLEEELANARKLRLADFTPRELMQELKRKGYEGKLTYVETHTIDLSTL